MATHSDTCSNTNGGVECTRQQPAGREQLGLGALLIDNSTCITALRGPGDQTSNLTVALPLEPLIVMKTLQNDQAKGKCFTLASLWY